MRLTAIAVLALLAVHCTRDDARTQQPGVKERVVAAQLLTSDCAASRLSALKVHASAAGSDCGILFIETPMVLEGAIVEAMHYGNGAYELYHGGFYQFSRARAFRGVTYKDGSGEVWFYGNVSRSEAESLRPCR
jgi:hypothetical protein